VQEIARRIHSLPIALGIEPWFANEDVDDAIRIMDACQPTAVGEIGLDLGDHTPCWPMDRQVRVLEAQLDCAIRLNIPVTLHCRKAANILLSVLRNHPGIPGVLHAFSGSYDQAHPFLDLGLYIGVGGAITRSHCKRLRHCASLLPNDRILLETDAPAISMDGIPAPHVRPAHIVHVRDALAIVRSTSPELIEQSTDHNASVLLPIRW